MVDSILNYLFHYLFLFLRTGLDSDGIHVGIVLFLFCYYYYYYLTPMVLPPSVFFFFFHK